MLVVVDTTLWVQRKKNLVGDTLGMGRLVVEALGELVITAPGGLVNAVLGAGHQGGGGAGDRRHRSVEGVKNTPHAPQAAHTRQVQRRT